MQQVMAQSPGQLNYQAVVRDVSGNPVANTTVGVKLSILQGSSSGTAVCIEEFSPATNAYGLVTLKVGSVNTVEFKAIDWSAGPYYIKVGIDASGGTTYTEVGTSQLLSVPYALHALTVGDFEGEIIINNTGLLPNSEQLRFFSNGTEMSRIQSYTSDELNAMMVFSNIVSDSLIEHMRLTSAGNLGIGTGSPQTRLNLDGGTDASFSAGSGYFQVGPVSGQNIIMDDNEILSRNNGSKSSLSLQNDGGDLIVHHNVVSGTEFIIKDNGNVGVGTLSPQAKLDVNGTIAINGYYPADAWSQGLIAIGPVGGYFGSQGNYRSYWTWNGYRQSGTNQWVVGGAHTYTSSNLISLGENGIDLRTREYGSTGVFSWPHSRMLISNDGKIGVNSINPTSKFEIQGESFWSDETPLFEVKNNDGITVFAVYNNGVRITVEDDPFKKGPKGGFAIGGFDPTKAGATVDFMKITPDSIRFNINNSSSKGPKGGFAIGGFDRTKGTFNEDFMYITPTSSSSGSYNNNIGYQSGYSLSGGLNNVMIGYRSGYNTAGSAFLSEGSRNIFIGNYAGYDNISGRDNIAIGHEAGRKILGNENIYIGTGAGKALTGRGNIIIGKYVDGVFGSSEDDNFVLSNGAGLLPLMAGNFNQRIVAIDGVLFVYDAYANNIGGGADLYIASNGEIGTISSSKRYKENITAMDDISWFYDLDPVEFSYTEDPLSARQYGLIAEEVEKVDPYFVSYDQEGQVYTVSYSKFISPMIRVIHDQDERIRSLEREIDLLRQMVMEMAAGNQ